jgi:Leucine-rich repeat (LRR) protein
LYLDLECQKSIHSKALFLFKHIKHLELRNANQSKIKQIQTNSKIDFLHVDIGNLNELVRNDEKISYNLIEFDGVSGDFLGSSNNLDNLSIYLSQLSHLKSLELNLPNTTIEPNTFIQMKSLENLTLLCKKLVLKPYAFKGLEKSLKHLNLEINMLGDIKVGIFDGLESLLELNLRENEIKSIENGSFSNLKSLKKLDLSRNSLERFANEWFEKGNCQLEDLDLSENDIQPNSADLSSFKKLIVLKLKQSFIKCSTKKNAIPNYDIHAIFNGLTSLTHLDLSNNRFSIGPHLNSHPDIFDSLTNLKVLDLSFNDIQTLNPFWFKNLFNLEELNLDDKHIKSLQDNILSILNRLMKLSLCLKSKSIDSQVFNGLSSLQYLKLSNCYLDKIDPDSFKPLSKSLVLLELNINFLEIGLFKDMNSLKYLSVNVENISNLGLGMFDDLISLRELHINCDKVENFDRFVFKCLFNLKLLSLVLDRINFDAQIFRELFSLEKLAISVEKCSNKLDVSMLKNSENLSILRLTSNCFKSIDKLDFEKKFPSIKILKI